VYYNKKISVSQLFVGGFAERNIGNGIIVFLCLLEENDLFFQMNTSEMMPLRVASNRIQKPIQKNMNVMNRNMTISIILFFIFGSTLCEFC